MNDPALFNQQRLYYQSGITPLRRKALNKIATGRDAPNDQAFTAGEALVVWTGLLLEQVPVVPDERQLLLAGLRDMLVSYGDNQHLGQIAPCQLVMLDTHTATWTTRANFLDLLTGEELTELPQPAVQSVAYNISELFRRNFRRYEELVRREV